MNLMYWLNRLENLGFYESMNLIEFKTLSPISDETLDFLISHMKDDNWTVKLNRIDDLTVLMIFREDGLEHSTQPDESE